MAFTHALPRYRNDARPAGEQLANILSGPLPDLGSRSSDEVTTELRRMTSEWAETVWRHPGWAAVVGWVLRQAPESEPTLAAVHAVRNATRASNDADFSRSLARYVRQVARSS